MRKQVNFAVVILGSLALAAFTADARKTPTFEPVVVSNAYDGWWGRTLADVNKDGLLDVVVLKQSRVYGPIKPGWIGWFEAKEAGKKWERHTVSKSDLFGAGDMAAKDIDGDGDIDFMAFEADETFKDTTSRMYWLENPGDPKAPDWKKHFIDKTPEFVKDVELADFDKDGKLDIATVTYYAHRIEIHRQEAGNSWKKVAAIKLENLHEGMDVGDIDGDGDVDVAANGYWVENPGKDLTAEWKKHVINSRWHNQTDKTDPAMEWRKNGTKVFCKDLNKDGRAEVFISHSEANRDGFPVAWYELKDPKTGVWTEHIIADNFRHCHTLQVFDMDMDGDMDVVTGEIPEHPTQKRVRIFLNEGNNLKWKEHKFSETGIYNGLVGDLEGDGDFDIFTAPGYSEKYPEYKVFINQAK